jgi:hypothetical protein
VVIDRQHGGAQVPADGEYEVCRELRQQAVSTPSSGALLQLPIDVALLCLYSRVQFGECEAPHRQGTPRAIIFASPQRRSRGGCGKLPVNMVNVDHRRCALALEPAPKSPCLLSVASPVAA